MADRGLAELGCQRATEAKLHSGNAHEGQAQQRDRDSCDPAGGRICFHGPSVSPSKLRVLIEKTHPTIKETNGRNPNSILPSLRGLGIY